MMDYRRYAIYQQSLVCDACGLDLMEMYGQTALNTLLYVIKEHDKEAHDS